MSIIILFCVTLFLFAPSMIYICNVSEFWFTPDLLYPLIAICTLIAIVGLSGISAVLKKINVKWNDIFIFGLFLLTILFYIQGNLIPDSNGELDGTDINWEKINLDMILSDLLWFAGVAVFAVCVLKQKCGTFVKKQTYTAIGILVFEVLMTVLTLCSVGGFDFEKGRVCSDKGEFEYSQSNNMIILLLDRLDGEYMKDNATEEQLGNLEGFTFYYDTMGYFGRTSKALPHIITGIPYFYETDYKDYLNTAYDSSLLLSELNKNNWSVGIYTCEPIPQNGEAVKYIENFSNVKLDINSKKRFIMSIYRIVGYSYMPYHLKQYFEFYADSILDERKIVDEDSMYSWKNPTFYLGIDNMSAERKEDVFRFYHLEGLHTSTTTAQCTESEEEQELIDIYQGNMLLIDKFITKLKEIGVYDNSIIIIMGDHGYSSDTREGWDGCFWGTNPCFMVKGFGEKHDFALSSKPVSYEDLQTIYSNLLQGYSAEKSTGFILNDIRERYFYRIDVDDWDSLLIEYKGTGPAADYKQLEETGVEYNAE